MPGAHAQTDASAKLPEWDIVSVKQNKDIQGPENVHLSADGDGITITNIRMQWIIQMAYDYRRPDLVFGLPDWAKSENYDIVAKVAGPDVERYHQLKISQIRLMLQSILAERFQLKSHYESREFPVYALMVAKGGLKMKEAAPGNAYANGLKGSGGTVLGAHAIMWTERGLITGQAVKPSELAIALSGTRSANIGRQIIDKTGLTGQYDFTLRFTADESADAAANSTDASAPSIFTALQEQLGLKLESTKGPIECLVVDHLERPSGN